MARKKYNPKTRKVRTSNWSEAKKVDAVALFKKNNFDEKITANELGVAATTLRLWVRQQNVTKPNLTLEQRASDIEIIYGELDHDEFTIDAFKTKHLALKRLRFLIETEKDTRRLVDAIKLLHDIAAPPIDVENKGVSLVDLFMDMQNEVNNAK